MNDLLTPPTCLPADRERATLVGRAWLPSVAGPALVVVKGDALHDLSSIAPTASALLEMPDAARAVRAATGLPRVAALSEILANSAADRQDNATPWLLAPCDLQAIKASGVTFVSSMLERVIEEHTRGDPAQAESVRQSLVALIGDDLRNVRPGSPEAKRVKDALVAAGAWSQYLEVGIGPDAEIFTKAQPMSAVGLGAEIGIHPKSEWNNPEPEIVLAVNSRGETVGATLGNDVNLRDFEGRSALLLGKAKDNNASCAIGPFIRLFDDDFGIDDVRRCELAMRVDGPEGFTLDGLELDGDDQPRPAGSRRRTPSAPITSIRTGSCFSWARCSRRPRIASGRARVSPTPSATSSPSRRRSSARSSTASITPTRSRRGPSASAR